MWKMVREVVFRFSYCRPQYEKRTNGIYTDRESPRLLDSFMYCMLFAVRSIVLSLD